MQIYYEFVSFFQLSGLYEVTFTALGSYPKLQAKLGFEPDHVWTKEEKSEFLYGFRRFKEAFARVNGESLDITPADALRVMQYTAGWSVTINKVNADMDANGTVNLTDALLIFQTAAGN